MGCLLNENASSIFSFENLLFVLFERFETKWWVTMSVMQMGCLFNVNVILILYFET